MMLAYVSEFRKRSLFLFIAVITASNILVAQNLVFDRVNTQNLTNPFVSSLFQDEKGYLWVGTIGGLNKYNGYGFTRYRYLQDDSTSLSNPAITSFYQNDINFVYVGTRNGLNIYNYNTDKFQRIFYDQNSENASLKNNINCITAINKKLVLGTADGILILQDSSLLTVTHKNSKLLQGWNVNCMCVDRNSNLWIGAKKTVDGEMVNEVFHYSFASRRLVLIEVENATEHRGISEDYLGNIWVAADNGLICVQPGSSKTTFYPAPNGFYSNVSYTHTKDNFIWQCYWSFGITSFDIDKKEYQYYSNIPDQPKSLMSNKCWALLKDANEILWIGTDVGLQKVTNKRPGMDIVRKNVKDEKNSFRGNIINSVYASRIKNHVVYAGIDGEGFSIFNKLTRNAENFGPTAENKNPERFVNQFIEDHAGNIFILGQNHFQKMSFNSAGKSFVKTYFNFQEHYCATGIMDPIDTNRIWIGGKAEIFYYDRSNEKFKFFTKPRGIEGVFYCSFIIQDQLYFGFRNGLLQIDLKDQSIKKIDLPNVGNISCAIVTGDGKVLLGSQFLGIIMYSPISNKFGIMLNKNNEYFSEPSSMIQYKNNIWLTGNGGLTSYNKSNGEITEITTEDGLPSNVVHKLDQLDGYFYVASHEGLGIMNPDFQVSHFISPKLDVTKFQVLSDNATFSNIKNGDVITLSENQNTFKINFTVLDFNLPEKNRFKFRLLPLEKEWRSPVGENYLIFNSLAPGKYRFELLGANADQIWSMEPFVINIHIVPPFYKSKWFYPLLVIILLAIFLMIIYLRFKANTKKQILLEKIIKERTSEIQQQRAELMDSIIYAKRIQKAIFVGAEELHENLNNSFIYNKAKDKVSGDFYWIGRCKDMMVVFVGDCTGHGVPGAMLSIVGTSLLNQIIHEEFVWMPGEILTRLNYLFYRQLSLDLENIRDGMDAAVITVNLVNHSVYYSGAKLDAVCVKNNVLTDLKSHRVSIGEYKDSEFKTQTLEQDEQRTFYLFSDGMKDQHGGPDGKKLSMKRLREILIQASGLPMNEQKQFIYNTVNSWKAGYPQTDDMMLVSFKV